MHHDQKELPCQKPVTIPDSKHMHNNWNVRVLQCGLTQGVTRNNWEGEREEERGGMEIFFLSRETSWRKTGLVMRELIQSRAGTERVREIFSTHTAALMKIQSRNSTVTNEGGLKKMQFTIATNVTCRSHKQHETQTPGEKHGEKH